MNRTAFIWERFGICSCRICLRKIAVVVLVISVAILFFLKADWKRILPKAYEITVCVFLGLVAVLGIAIAVNFDRCFVIFHELFFDNDLWMFDPASDI